MICSRVLCFTLLIVVHFGILKFCEADSLVGILKDKVVALDNSLTLDIRLLRQEFDRLSDLLDDTLETFKAGEGQLRPGDPDSQIKHIEVPQDFERAMVRVKRAFAEEKTGLKKFTSTMKAEIYKLSSGINKTLNEFEISYIETNKESNDRLNSFQIDLTKDLSQVITDLGTNLSSSINSMSIKVANQTSLAVSAMKTVTQNVDTVPEIKSVVDDISHNKSHTPFASSAQANEIDPKLEQITILLNSLHMDNMRIVQKGIIRLVNVSDISNAKTGDRLEVRHNDIWGTVCDDKFDENDAKVACKWLGFSGGVVKDLAFYGQGHGPIWLDNLSCTGIESTLFDCGHRWVGVHDCGHYEDVGVICVTPSGSTNGY